MARENTTIIYGWIAEPPVENEVDEETTEYRMKVLTKRKTYVTEEMLLRGAEREDYVPVATKNRAVKEHIERELIIEDNAEPGTADYLGYFVLIKGSLCTGEEEVIAYCPGCGYPVPVTRTTTYVDPIVIVKCRSGVPAAYAEALDVLHEHIEVGSMSLLYGSLWREPEYYEGGNTELRFPVRSVRKRHIFEDPAEKRADYPWVRSFGEGNSEFAKNIHNHSSIFINGAIQSRQFEGRDVWCPGCDSVFEIPGETSELIPYAVKYQAHCGQETDEYGEYSDVELSREKPDENTVIMFGWLYEAPEFTGSREDDTQMARLKLLVCRKAYETEDPLRRGKTESEKFWVRTQNRELVDYIANNLVIPQESDDPAKYRGCIVLLKGTLYTEEMKSRARCGECQKEFIRTHRTVSIDPIGIWRESGPVTLNEASFIMHGAVELGNMALCHGTLLDDPLLSTEGRPECRFPVQLSRIRRIWGEKGATDPCWVTVAGQKALECGDALHEGSIVFINGALRPAYQLDVLDTCPHCGAEVSFPRLEAELVPYQVEYHADCIIPDSIREEEETED